jgi:CLIP-associating protein 1/2
MAYAVVDQAPVLSSSDGSSVEDELQGAISALEQNKADTRLLQRLSRLCIENPSTVTEPASPVSSSFDSFGQTPASPSPFIVDDSQHTPQLAHSELWTKGKKFERLFNALMIFLDPAKVCPLLMLLMGIVNANGVLLKSEAELEYGLIVLWEMLENQAAYVEGREGDIFSMLLTVRYCNKQNVSRNDDDNG